MQKKSKISFTRLCAVSYDIAYLGTNPEGQELATPFTAICQYNHGEWSYEAFDFSLASLSLYEAAEQSYRILYVLAEAGIAVDFDTKAREILIPAKAPIRKDHRLGYLRKIRQIGEHLFACGDGGQLLQRASGGEWEILDPKFLDGPDATLDPSSKLRQHLFKMHDPSNNTQENFDLTSKLILDNALNVIWDIAGLSEKDIYLASEKNAVYHYDGERISKLETEADSGILAVHAVDADTVYACGRDGNFLFGNSRDGFRKLNVPGSPVFNGMASFQGKLYLSSIGRPRGLFVFDGAKLERVEGDLVPGIDDVSAVSAVGDEVLWVMGEKDLLRFDGKTWERILFPSSETMTP
ncbi:hypothetical protein RRU01S_35_00220 [Agrobacterium rubi TR3 = NBRC 13261]|uniref:Uncharacterized protein n=1 Tax=Agrobacterium rubi TR3 = NBRC 13261 TaxID=1368415 RepID=A0A081D317_9HYPH|nr:hypothetical protein [Agrobacterium rubi]MCL6655475.1 hypothetical protein [Agrobacterium rubi]GAK73313.1 hypothetical protein RRU01S_35_00220 [Agrobacterium rubi TR3 = NBRC 13261]